MDPASIGIGCFAGLLAGAGAYKAVASKRQPQAANGVPGLPGAGKGMQVGALGAFASPGQLMSPPTHLRRDPWVSPKAGGVKPTGRSINSKAFLTSSLADLDKYPGISREFNQAAFIELLRKLIGVTKQLQNNPRLGVHPQEKLAAKIVLEELAPYLQANGGPLIAEEMEYVPGRSNLKITYPGTGSKTLAFAGSHFDVVPADPESWDKDPFTLTQEGDRLYGRGTTDCLGHVALITRMLAEMGKHRPKLKRSIVVLFIAGEEGGENSVGVDKVVYDGKFEEAKRGPVFWVDSADSQPCCGTSGMLSWTLKFTGRLFHSGLPHKGINSIELASECLKVIQERFYDDFKPHADELGYRYATGSHMKPTQIECAKGSLNQINPETRIMGDIRLSPFYDVEHVVEAIEQYVKDLNEDEIGDLPTRGPWSKFVLPDDCQVMPNEQRRGKVELTWMGNLESFKLYQGLAVDLESEGHKALVQAFRETYASCSPFSITGSLPLVRMMQGWGFDIQICGFGLMSVYHGVNEYCTLGDMEKANEVLARTIILLESTAD